MPKPKLNVSELKTYLNTSIAELGYKDNNLQGVIYTAKKSIEEQKDRQDQKSLLKAKVESLIQKERLDTLYQLAIQNAKEALQSIAMYERDPLVPQAIYYLTVIQNLAHHLDSDAYRKLAQVITKKLGTLPKEVLGNDFIQCIEGPIDSEFIERRLKQLFPEDESTHDTSIDDLARRLKGLE